MKRGMKTFSRGVRDGEVDKAKGMFEKVVQGHMDDEVWEGYNRALKGIVESLESGEDLTLPRQLAGDKFSIEKIEDIKKEMEERASQEFRSDDERGYNSAWSDVLQVILEDAKSD